MTYKIYKTNTKLSDVIKNLQIILEKHGDYHVEAWQHPEEYDNQKQVNNIFVDFEEKTVLIS